MDVPYNLAAYVRVLKLASTPDWEEFYQVSMVAGAGVLIIGLIGFAIFLFMTVLTGAVG